MTEVGGDGVRRGGVGATSWRADAGGAMPASSQHCTALVIHFSSNKALDHSEGGQLQRRTYQS